MGRNAIVMALSIPLIAELLLAPFWFSRAPLPPVWIAPAQFAVSALAVPIFLAVMGVRSVATTAPRDWPMTGAVLATSELIAVSAAYILWGLSSGMLNQPDSETLILLEGQIILAGAIIAIPFFVAVALTLVRSRNWKRRPSA